MNKPMIWALSSSGVLDQLNGSEKYITEMLSRSDYYNDWIFFFAELTTEGVMEGHIEPVQEPRISGFYKYSGGNQNMVFLLRDNHERNEFLASQDMPVQEADWQWFVIDDNGQSTYCKWDYIEQGLGVWDLVRM